MSIVIALLLFSFIVFIHELGHFIFAKRGGIVVEEFAIGMGPKIFGFNKNGTEWTIRILPIGGFCRMKGEDGREIVNEEISSEENNGAFYEQPVGVRIMTIFGGPLFNFILALGFAFILMSVTPIVSTDIGYILEGSPAEQAGLMVGDDMVSIDGHYLLRPREANIYINVAAGESVDVKVKRTAADGTINTLSIPITPASVEIDETVPPEESDNYYYIGVGYESIKTSIFGVIKYGILETLSWIKVVFYSLGLLITGQVPYTSLSGPVGLVSEISSGYEASLVEGLKAVIGNLSFWVVLISANLGIMNLLPIPALDGGRLSFLLVEVITKRKIAPEKEGFIHFIGFALLMILMVLVMYNDILRALGWN